MKSFSHLVFCATLLAFASAPTRAIGADEPLEEVLVTAQLRERLASDTPASVTVLNSTVLQEAGQQHLADVLSLIPNLNWAAGSSRPRYFQLRGIGELEQWQGAPNPSVGFLIDDVDFSGVGMPATLFDMDQVEVLRGPQGVTYGANALAGIIAMRTHAPSEQFEARMQADAGNDDLQGIGGVLSGPLGESGAVAYRLVGQRQRSNGFRNNIFLDRNDTNRLDETTLRARLRWRPAGEWRADATAFWVDIDNGYDAFSIDNSRVTLSDNPGRDAQRSVGTSLRVGYFGWRNAELKLVSAAADSRIAYSFDGDWGNNVSWGANGPYDYTSVFDRQRRSFSQDIRLISTESTPLSWTLGLYALRLTEDGTQLDRYNGDTLRELTSSYRSTNSALYGEVSREVATETTLSVGARLERRDVRYDDSDGESLAPGETMWGATVTALHRLGAGRSLYLSVSRGYKAGGFNLGAAIPSERREFSAEYLESAEVGLKAQDDDRRLRGSLALFWMERREQQVENSTQIVPGDPLSFVYYTDNAARGRNLGLEAAVDWQATRRWSIGGSLGLLRATYLEYVTAGRDLSGRDQPHAPRYQFASYAAYRHPHGWFARIDVSGRDEFYFAASHDERSRAYTVTNLKVGLEWRAATIEFWARNLFDRAYSQRGFSFGNEPPDFPVRLYTQAADPRQIGVTLHYAWD